MPRNPSPTGISDRIRPSRARHVGDGPTAAAALFGSNQGRLGAGEQLGGVLAIADKAAGDAD